MKKLFVSFSGGETSAFMCNWLLKNKSDEYEMKFVFANTGEENEETLRFVEQCDRYFGLDVKWVEFDVVEEKPTFKEVDFYSAYRSHDPEEIKNKWQNHPFRKMIARHGIPNMQNMICTRELKQYPMTRYLSSIGWKKKDYEIAIGIRADEIDRLGAFYYPMAETNITKPMINSFWDKMPFRLDLKGYEGNCKTCWKKSARKLGTLAKEHPEWFGFMEQMEKEYGNYTHRPITEDFKPPFRFFRDNKTVADIFKIPQDPGFEVALDDSININYQTSILHDGTELDLVNGCVESCEIEF